MMNAGKMLERQLVAECEGLWLKQRAWVKRAHPDVQVVRPVAGGRVEGFTKGTRLDFEGVLCGGGRAVVVEAKTSHAAPSWPLGDVGDAQMQRMACLARCGALVLLYVQRWEGARPAASYLLPVDGEGRIAGLVAHPALAILSNERKSIRWADLEPWRVGPQELWLDAAERLLGGA
jgi:penicillin-binding protein-related factor A (putative recombinase)